MGTSAQEVTMEEMEDLAKIAEAETSKAGATTKLEASDVPDALRGKTVDSLIETNRRLEESLRISEDARTALRREAHTVTDRREEATEDPADRMTREEFEELYKTEPMKALEIYDRRLTKSILQNVEARFGSLKASAASSQLEHAKAKHKIEFELFEKEIMEVARQIEPDVLATEKGWNDIIRYVRGQDDNIDKFVEAKSGRTREVAREEAVKSTGFTSRSDVRATVRTNEDTQGLDETERRIALNQFSDLQPEKAYAEYLKWRGKAE